MIILPPQSFKPVLRMLLMLLICLSTVPQTVQAKGRIATTTDGYVLTAGDPLANDVWSHVAMTYDAQVPTDNFRLYVHGTLVGKMTATGTLKTGKGIVFVGSDHDYRYWDGITIDELRLWNYARSESQLRETLFSQLSSGTKGLRAYYPFNATTRDATGHGSDGVLIYRESFASVTQDSQIPGAHASVVPGSDGKLQVVDRGLRFDLSFSGQSVVTDTPVTYSGLAAPTHTLPDGNKDVRAFRLDAQTTNGQQVGEFRQPYIITISYTDAILAELGINDACTLDIVYWNGTTWIFTHGLGKHS